MGTLSFIWGDLANSSNSAASITAIICEAIIIISVINGIFICILKCMQNKSKKNSEENEIMRSILAEQAKQQAKLQDELRLYQRQKANFLEKQTTQEALNLKDNNKEERKAFTDFVDGKITKLEGQGDGLNNFIKSVGSAINELRQAIYPKKNQEK